MLKALFRTKKIDTILADADKESLHEGGGLKRVLSLKDLTFFGIAAIIGAGSFSSLGEAIFRGGPGVLILFIICGIACGFTAMCYAEFSSRIPVAGSAYTYAYASFGELFAWIIGWALIMEYSIGNIYVAFSWSDYFTSFLSKLNIHLPDYLTCSYMEVKKAIADNTTKPEFVNAWRDAPNFAGVKFILDIPALIINILITYLVYIGVKESRNFSNAMVILKLAVITIVILVGAQYIMADNWLPANKDGIKSFMPNGFSGVMSAVSGVFFAYIGFDAISVMAEESKNPQRDLPRSMILSLVICTVVYILLTLVLTGALNFSAYENVGDPLAKIFEANGNDWMQFLVSICAIVAITSVLLVFQMGQPRIWMSMSRDGLMPKKFNEIHPKYKTPKFATIITGLVVGVPILFTDRNFILDFTSIGTLFAFVLVCGGVLLLPKKEKIKGRFNMPFFNAKFIFPGLQIGAIALILAGNSSYFKELSTLKFTPDEVKESTIGNIKEGLQSVGSDLLSADISKQVFNLSKMRKDPLKIALDKQVESNNRILNWATDGITEKIMTNEKTKTFLSNTYPESFLAEKVYNSETTGSILYPLMDSIKKNKTGLPILTKSELDALQKNPNWDTAFNKIIAKQLILNDVLTSDSLQTKFPQLEALLFKDADLTKTDYTAIQMATNKAEGSLIMQRVSLLIFWAICAILAIFAFLKNWSLIPLLGLVSCLYLLTGMAANNWKWFAIWFAIGLVIYALYGFRKSKLAK